ncbi:MAG: ABC transporter permease subunit [Chloroflexi bacterium]|nr:ABC transporter permease subunit [Chloroflexota bacterium]
MFLRSIYLKTLRDHRVGALAWGFGPGVLLLATLTQFEQLVGSAEARAALVAMAQQFSWYEEPIGITRPGGFATFRLGPMLGILPSVWALLAASGTLRGEEARGALDLLLATPRSRARVVWEKLAGLATALVVMALVLGTLVWLAGVTAKAEYGALDAYVFGLNVALTAGTFGAIALLVSQFTSERGTAAGMTGGFLALSFLLHSTGRVSPNVKWVSYLSPLYYAGLTKPLVPEVGINPGAMLVLAAIVVVCAGGAAWLFTRRDLGFGYRLPLLGVLPASGRPAAADGALARYAFSGEWPLRSVYLRSLRTSGQAALWWAGGMAGFAVWMTAIGKQLQENLVAIAASSPLLAAVFSRIAGGAQANALFLGMLVFTFTPLVISAFAVTQAARWAADEEEGRTEMVLASPVPRWRALLARFAAIATVLLGISLAIYLSVAVAAAASGLALEQTHLLAAAFGLVPVALVVACLGAALAGWLRSGSVTGGLILYVVASFFVMFVGPIFNWPKALIRLSIYDVYGSPLAGGWDWAAMSALTTVAGVCLALATYRFRVKDLAR